MHQSTPYIQTESAIKSVTMAANQRTYEDFEPPVEWTNEDGCSILTIYLPGFSKEQLRVQVSSRRRLRISGERSYRNDKWRRFEKEFQIPSNCDTNKITAKLKGGMLYVSQPLREEPKPPREAPKEQPPENQSTKEKRADSETSSGKQKEAPVNKSSVAREEKAKSDEGRDKTTDDRLEDNAGKAGKDTTALANNRNKKTSVAGRFREVILGNLVKLVLAILLAVLLFLYARSQSPTIFVGEPPQ